MHLLIIRFQSGLPETDVQRILEERLPVIRATPGLLQKYYTRGMSSGDYVGVHVFDSAASVVNYQESEIVRSIRAVYRTLQPPRLEALTVSFCLRPELPFVTARP